MILLLMCVLMLGKIVGQQILVPQYVGTQAIPVLTPAAQEFHRVLVVPSLQRLQNSAATINQLLKDKGSGNNLSQPPQVAVRDNQPRRELFVPARVGDTMNVNRPFVKEDKPGFTERPTTPRIQNESEVYDKVYLEDNKTVSGEQSDVNTLPSVISTPFAVPHPTVSTGDPPIPNSSTSYPPVATLTPQNVTKNKVTNITFDQRNSFNGDKCPTGQIRVNGSSDCIKPD